MNAHFLSPIVASAAGWRIVNARTNAVIADAIETAFDSASRRRGLLGRTSLPEGCALIIAPCNAVHTFGMHATIDVVFVARNGQVVKLREAMAPRRISAALRAFATIELPAHSIAEKYDLAVEDMLRLEPSSRV